MGRIKYNFTEEELVQIYLDFSRNLWKERKGTTALDIKKSHKILTYRHMYI